MKAEEIAVQNGKSSINVLVKVLNKNKSYSEAWSVVQRHSEVMQNYIVRNLEKKCKNPDFVENKLLKDDYYGPTEVFMDEEGKEKEEDYLTMMMFGFEKDDVYFVGGDGEDLKFTCEHFLNAKHVSSQNLILFLFWKIFSKNYYFFKEEFTLFSKNYYFLN